MPAIDPAAARALTELLEHEETLVAELLRLAVAQQSAIVHGEYAEIDRLSAELESTANHLDGLQVQRDEFARTAFGAGTTLAGIAGAVTGPEGGRLGAVRASLASRAGQLAAQQERNANLLLGAMRLHDRWMNLLAGMARSTYGAGGRQEFQQTRGIVSRSA